MQEAFCQWLRSEGLPFFRQRMDRAATGTVGWPDFTVCLSNRVLLIETKFGKGKLSTAQVFCHAELARAGCRVHVVRNLSAACELVSAWRQQREDLRIPGENLKLVMGAYWRETPSGYVKVRNA